MSRKLKPLCFTLAPDTLPIYVHVAYSDWDTAIKYYRRKTGCKDLTVDDLESDASCSAWDNHILLWFRPNHGRAANQFAALVSHECIHAAFKMANRLGTMFDPGVQEPMCYFVQYLVQNITGKIWRIIK